jgi:subtilase family serine protease
MALFSLRKNPKSAKQSFTPEFMEPLEARQMLSAAGGTAVMHYFSKILGRAAGGGGIQGYSPAEVRHAYGFDQVSPGDGAGQTIAIVDAYDDPNIIADLATFDAQFGLNAPPSFSIVDQTGGGQLPTVDSGWAGEIALDVEWAHAVAPQANIVLVEATSSSVSDLMAAVDFARHAPGVSVVSMSWGGSEFETFGGAEFTSQTDYDPFFTTPTGHQGVTFIASAGDTGVAAGSQWPSTSPQVMSVGGTALFTADSAGTYSSESSWAGTNGGYSLYEAPPTYQRVATGGSNVRVVPDVTYNGDPNTGVAVYDSLPDQAGNAGWLQVGGTSAGAPQWAALIAIANQSRATAGNPSLDGPTGTLPALYSVYSAPGTAGYANYTANFNDIIDSPVVQPGATPGYDILSGLGSPHVPAIITLLTGAATGQGGSSTGGTTAIVLLPSQVGGTLVTAPPPLLVAGATGKAKVKLYNTSVDSFAGPVTVTVYASTSATLDASATVLATSTIQRAIMHPRDKRSVTMKVTYPKNIVPGAYYMISSTTTPGTHTLPSNSVSRTLVQIEAPSVDLVTSFGTAGSIAVRPGSSGTANLTIQNLGNVTAVGSLDYALYASLDESIDPSDLLLGSGVLKKISIAPGRSITLHIRFKAPAGLAPGSYNLIAAVNAMTQPADSDTNNNVAVLPTR